MSHEPTSHKATSPGSHEATMDEAPSRQTRWLYIRVLLVQAVAMAALWILQSAFGR